MIAEIDSSENKGFTVKSADNAEEDLELSELRMARMLSIFVNATRTFLLIPAYDSP